MAYERTTMTRKMSFAFADFIEAQYKATGLNNVEFARHATEHLPFPVTQTMVRSMCRDLDIPPNVTRQTAQGQANVQLLTDRVGALEEQVKFLVQTVRALAKRQINLTDWDTTKKPVT